ncbi:MAG: hypothetical protein R3E48_10725 [Burkholderiaceae bacterium]
MPSASETLAGTVAARAEPPGAGARRVRTRPPAFRGQALRTLRAAYGRRRRRSR